MRRRHRRMYQLTGLPGWARAGYHGGGCCGGEHGPSHHESGHHGGACSCGEHGPSHHGPMPREACHESSWGGPWGAPPTAEEERDFLKAQAEALRRYLGRIERRISELEPTEA